MSRRRRQITQELRAIAAQLDDAADRADDPEEAEARRARAAEVANVALGVSLYMASIDAGRSYAAAGRILLSSYDIADMDAVHASRSARRREARA